MSIKEHPPQPGLSNDAPVHVPVLLEETVRSPLVGVKRTLI